MDKIEGFQDLFGTSRSGISFTEPAEVSQSVQEIQEDLKLNKREISKLDTSAATKGGIIGVLLLALFGLGIIASSSFGEWYASAFAIPALFGILAGTKKLMNKTESEFNRINNRINQLRIDLLQKHLNGKVDEKLKLNHDNWNTVKVQKEHKTVEYMVRFIEDSNGMEMIESRELR